MNENSRIYVAGHCGLVGSAIWRELQRQGFDNLIGHTRQEVNLLDADAVQKFFAGTKPEFVFIAAAKVGGIYANDTFPAEFIYENLAIQNNVIHQAFKSGVKRLLFLGSSCIYPKLAPQPMCEDALLTGPLEPTNEPYAIAKIAGIKMCESYNRQYGASHGVDYRSVMPTNLYGPGDNYHPQNSHVVPALIRRFHEAAQAGAPRVEIWGTGTPRREFLHVDDMASASVYVMQLAKEEYDRHTSPRQSHINVGCGEDVTIAELAKMIAQACGYKGEIAFDASKPDGAPRKLMDSARLAALGWRPKIDIRQGLVDTVAAFASSAVK